MNFFISLFFVLFLGLVVRLLKFAKIFWFLFLKHLKKKKQFTHHILYVIFTMCVFKNGNSQKSCFFSSFSSFFIVFVIKIFFV